MKSNVRPKLFRLALIGVGVLLSARLVSAQTWTQTSAPSQNWQAVASSADGKNLIAGSGDWIYYISTNSGNTWTSNSEPQKLTYYYGSWTSIASSADGDTLAAINYTVLWTSTNSGLTWVSNNLPGAVFFSSLALSADGKKLVIVDGNPSTGGSHPGVIYISTNAGVTVTPTTAPTNNWTSVASSADGTKLVAAAVINSLSGGLIYASTNSGYSWMLTGAPTNNAWITVASSADGRKLVAASETAFIPNQIYGCIYTSTNSGTTWTSNNVPIAQWQSVASSADGSKLVAVAAEQGWIYSSSNSGATWVSNSAPNDFWQCVVSSADGDVLVAAPLGDQSFNPSPIYAFYSTSSPQLNLALSPTNLTLAWTVPSTNFVLQQSTDLVSWVNVTSPPVLNMTNLQNQVTVSTSNSSSFYRLKTP